jgi:hypothetical protein
VSKSDKNDGKRGPLSGMRGVILGVGLGALAATKGPPLARQAMLKYLTSHATDLPGQATKGTPVG